MAEPGQQLDVAGRAVAEREVLPHHHRRHVQLLDQHLVHELVGRHLGELGGERQHAEHVDAQLLDQLGLATKRGQLRGMATRTDDLGRVRVERQQHAG
jgi:hypothetical protein